MVIWSKIVIYHICKVLTKSIQLCFLLNKIKVKEIST